MHDWLSAHEGFENNCLKKAAKCLTRSEGGPTGDERVDSAEVLYLGRRSGPTGDERVDNAEVLYLGRKAVRPRMSVLIVRKFCDPVGRAVRPGLSVLIMRKFYTPVGMGSDRR